MAMWEKILWGVLGVMIVVYFWPRAKAELERSQSVENKDWAGALLPIGIVVLFVYLLIMFVKS